MTADIEVLRQQSAAFNRYAGLLEAKLQQNDSANPKMVADLTSLTRNAGNQILGAKLEDFPILDQGSARVILENVAQRFARLPNHTSPPKG